MSPKFAGTGRARVTCRAAAAGQCASWAIELNAAVNNVGVANLYHFVNNAPLVLDGVYRNSYAVTAVR